MNNTKKCSTSLFPLNNFFLKKHNKIDTRRERFKKIHTCASWIFIEFPLALASDNFPFHTLLSPLYSYLLSRKLEAHQ